MAKRKFNKGGEVRLVAYYRYSGGSGQTEQSIEGQRRDCEAYARLHNMTIQKEYVDRHISGKTDDRAAFQQMIADSDKGAFDMVICWKTDRFARNRYDSAVYKKRLRDNGVEIVYAAESNISGAEGIIIEGVMEALAEYYSAELAEKMRRGMRESALKGQAISRCRALGLKTDEHKRFVIDEKTAPTVRFIFEHYAAGESAMSIVEQLNAKGLRTSQGNPFNKSSIPRIIQNEAYRGVYISKSYDVRIEGAIPAIIDDELWERAQTMLKLNRQLKAKNEPKADYILSGKLYCSCGSLMRGMSGHSATGEVYRYYTCPNKDCHLRNIPKDDLEGKVMQSIVDHLLQPESMEALAEAMVEVQKADVEKPNAERVAIEQSLSDVRRRSKNILDAIENGTANAQLCARLDDLTEQEQTLSFQLSSLEKEKPVVFTKEQYLFLLEQFLMEPSERTPEYGRRLVNTFVTSMVVSGRELVINFNVSDETVNKNKKTSQTNLQKESSSGMRLVQIERHELRTQHRQSCQPQPALKELYPREDGFRCTAESLPDDGNAPRQKLAGTERKAVQLECRSPLQAQQSHQNFSGPAQRLTERTADAFAENAEGWFRADAAGHAEHQIAVEQRLNEGRCQLSQKAECRQQRSTGRTACCSFPSHREDTGIDGKEPQQKAAPALHLFTKLLGFFQQASPEQDAAATCRHQIQQGPIGAFPGKKPQHRCQRQEQEH